MGKVYLRIELSDEYDGPFFPEATYKYASQERYYRYTDYTTIKQLLKYICKKGKFSDYRGFELGDFFRIKVSGSYCGFGNINARLGSLIRLLHAENKQIELLWVYRPGGGADVWEEDGIHFIIHTNEYIHRGKPHVHAKYSGDEVKIDLQSFAVTGVMKNKGNERLAIETVKRNRGFFYQKWRELVCGLEVPEFYYNEEEDLVKVLQVG